MPVDSSPPLLRSCAAARAQPLRQHPSGIVVGLCVALLLALAGCSVWLRSSTPAQRAAAPERTVQIQRTDSGTAHIQAADMEALAYGVAYAQAQESFCETADQLVTVRGERSRWFGAGSGVLLGGRSLNNLELDIFVRALMEDGELALSHRDTSADARALARGYVEGYNRYLADHGAGSATPLPADCAGQAWVRPMTLFEYRRLGELQGRLAASVPWVSAVVAARLPQPGAAAPTEVPLAQAARQIASLRLNDAGVGGVAWALGGEVAPEGGALLLTQMHGPWAGSVRWRQMRLTVPGRLEVLGARMGPGVPVQVGLNADLAWSHTPSAAHHATLFELKLVPGDPARYLVSGQAERMRARTVTVEMLRPDGRVEPRLHTVWMTRYGPVVAWPRAGLHWTAQTAYALRDANAWNARGTETWLALGQARSVGEAQVALQRLGTPWMATVAADRHGDTLFQDASSVPDVDAALLRRCAPSRTASALFGAAGLVVLDGSRGDCAWRTDPASAAPGLIAASHLPTLERRDWVQSTGDSYWLTNPALALGGLSPMAGPAEAPLALRSRASLQRLKQGVAELASAPLTSREALARMQALILDDHNLAAQLVLDDLLAACGAGVRPRPSAAARQACGVLAAWDRRDGVSSRGAWLFRQWWREARDLPDLWREPFDLKNPVNTPAGLRTTDARLRSRLLALLEQAAARVQAAGLSLDVPLGEVQLVPGPQGPMAWPGGDPAAGVLSPAQGPWDGEGAVPSGTSLLLAVHLGPGGPVAQGRVVPGQWPEGASSQAEDDLQAPAQRPWPDLPWVVGEVAAATATTAAERSRPVLTLALPPLPADAASAPPLPRGLQVPLPTAASAASSPAATGAAPVPLPVPTIRRPQPGASAPGEPAAAEGRSRP